MLEKKKKKESSKPLSLGLTALAVSLLTFILSNMLQPYCSLLCRSPFADPHKATLPQGQVS